MGVDMIKFEDFQTKCSKYSAEAALMALDDAGLGIQDMQALYCGNLGQANAMVGQDSSRNRSNWNASCKCCKCMRYRRNCF